MPRVLVAGVGNVLLGDDGFGVEVVRGLRAEALPEGVQVADFGIRAVHLAFEIAGGGFDAVILVDAMSRGGEPGTLYAVEADGGAPEAAGLGGAADAHAMTPDTVLAWVRRVGGRCDRVLIVGCEPARLDESMGLTPAVAAAVAGARELVLDLARDAAAGRTWSAPCA